MISILVLAFCSDSVFAAKKHDFEEIKMNASEAHPLPPGYTRYLKRKSVEWKEMPKQSWEIFAENLSKETSSPGIGNNARVQRRVLNRYSRPYFASPERQPVMGEISAARTPTTGVFLGDIVFIDADEPMQVGTFYDITEGPEAVNSDRDGRYGFVYQIKGRIKVIGVRDQKFIGVVTEMWGKVQRDDLLIPVTPPLMMKAAIAAPEAIEGSIMIPENSRVADQQMVMIDLGSAEGIAPGMVFRLYQKYDELTGDEISTKDFIIDAELQVLEVNESFSLAVVLSAKRPLNHGELVVSLTDIRDFGKDTELQTLIQDREPITTPDELDSLDPGQALGDEERRELRQLENVQDVQQIEGNTEQRGVGIGDENAPNDQKIENGLPVGSDADALDSGLDSGINAQPPAAPAEPAPEPTNSESGLENTDIQGSAPAPSEPAPVTEFSTDGAANDVAPVNDGTELPPSAAPTTPPASATSAPSAAPGAAQSSPAPVSTPQSAPSASPSDADVPNDLLELPPPPAPETDISGSAPAPTEPAPITE